MKASRLVRLPVGVSLSPVVAAVAAVATLVGRELRVTIRADQAQVLSSVVGRVPIDVVQHQGEVRVQPRTGTAADRKAAGLGVGEESPKALHHNRGTVSCDRIYDRPPTDVAAIGAPYRD